MKPSRRCYVLRSLGNNPTGLIAFVSHPHEASRWCLTHVSVVTTPCPACGVPAGSLCQIAGGYGARTHYVRRKEAKGMVSNLKAAATLVFNVERGSTGKKENPQ